MQPDAPKIEFPCDYPIKVMGPSTPDYKEHVIEIIEMHAQDIDYSRVTLRESRDGNYYAVTVFITATGKDQIAQIFESLKKSDRIKMVL
jgi:hypothetical protein